VTEPTASRKASAQLPQVFGTHRSRICLVNAEVRCGARSYLYVPGDSGRRLDRALARGADALILDLEDAVAATAKADARVLVGRWISEHEAATAELWVRLNHGSLALDIEGIAGVNLTGVVVPKAEPAVLAETDELLTFQERRTGLPSRSIAVLALIETARGLMSAADLASAPRVVRLGIGEVDLAADLRVELTDAGEEMTPLRLQVVVASAAAGIGAPVAPVARDYRDLGALRRSTHALRGLGFRARTAIHPAQVTVINEVFTPTTEEIQAARRLVDSFAAAERAGKGVLTDGRGQMVDAAVVRAARETLRRAGISSS
jgi:citrate lyase subunit beta / citryl-CoA lyase